MALVAGVDSSTQSCKVLVLDARTGGVVRRGRASHPDGTEVDPLQWLEARIRDEDHVRAARQHLVDAGLSAKEIVREGKVGTPAAARELISLLNSKSPRNGSQGK